MVNSKSDKEKVSKKFPVVKKASIPATLKLIPHGQTARYSCRDMLLSSVYSTISRMRQNGDTDYSVTALINGGEEFEITRK